MAPLGVGAASARGPVPELDPLLGLDADGLSGAASEQLAVKPIAATSMLTPLTRQPSIANLHDNDLSKIQATTHRSASRGSATTEV
jgi:hypothetical protein